MHARARGPRHRLSRPLEKDKALSALRQASKLDPGNWIIHKQIWAIEHPKSSIPSSIRNGSAKDLRRRERINTLAPDFSRTACRVH